MDKNSSTDEMMPENNEIKQLTPDAVLWSVYPAKLTANTELQAARMINGN